MLLRFVYALQEGSLQMNTQIDLKPGIHALYIFFFQVLVRWAKGKRLTNRLPNLNLITLSPSGTDGVLRVDAPPHAVPISGDPEAFSDS